MNNELYKILSLEQQILKLKEQLLKRLQNTNKSNLDLANEMGFSAQYICDVKKGRRPINTEYLKRLINISF